MKWPPTDDYALFDAVRAVLERGVLTNGPEVEALESEFAAALGLTHVVALSSGTSAIAAALLAAGVRAGDRVVVPAFTFSGSVLPVLHIGATPVFVDIDRRTFCLDPIKGADVARKTESAAILLVHLHGYPIEVPPDLRRELHEAGIRIVEDACQAAGAGLSDTCNVTLGQQGIAGAFSLNERKQIFSGEGGMLATTSSDLATRVRRLRRYGEPVEQEEACWRSSQSLEVGFNWKLAEIPASIARVSLRKLRQCCALANQNAQMLIGALKETRVRPPDPGSGRHAWHKFRAHCDDHDRDLLLQELRRVGVPASLWQTRILPEMPAFSRWAHAFGQLGYPNARRTIEHTLVIGDELHTLYGSTPGEVAEWAEKLHEVCR